MSEPIARLADSVHARYGELSRHAIRPTPDGANPAPGRCALPKLVVSRRRPTAAEKSRRDLARADMLPRTLLTDRPGDIVLAGEAARRVGGKVPQQSRQGLARLDNEFAWKVGELAGLHRFDWFVRSVSSGTPRRESRPRRLLFRAASHRGSRA